MGAEAASYKIGEDGMTISDFRKIITQQVNQLRSELSVAGNDTNRAEELAKQIRATIGGFEASLDDVHRANYDFVKGLQALPKDKAEEAYQARRDNAASWSMLETAAGILGWSDGDNYRLQEISDLDHMKDLIEKDFPDVQRNLDHLERKKCAVSNTQCPTATADPIFPQPQP